MSNMETTGMGGEQAERRQVADAGAPRPQTDATLGAVANARPPDRPRWTFLTNHARVLAAVSRDPHTRVRDIAALCELTERQVGAILTDLEDAGYLTRTRVGRRNVYQVNSDTRLRHPADGETPIAEVLDTLRPRRDDAD